MKRTADMFFPRAALYSRMLGPADKRVREPEPEPRPFHWSERHVQAAWFEMPWAPGALLSSDMETVFVESPGRWNLEAGPDFLDAVLLIGPGRRRIRGDVEVHVHPGDWTTHCHGGDPAYGGVVAHVSYFPGATGSGALPPGSLRIALKEALRSNPEFSFDALDLSAYPYARAPGTPTPCGDALRRMGPNAGAALLDAAGEERLRRKSERIRAAAEAVGEEQAIYEELACALGYKHNRVPFRRLARTVTVELLRTESGGDVNAAYALLMGTAGLLPANPAPDWDAETALFMRGLWDSWWKMRGRWQPRCLPGGNWRLSGLRPANQPVRRLAALAALFAQGPLLIQGVRQAVERAPQERPAFLQLLLARQAGFPYWDRRAALGRQPGRGRIALLGADRVAAIVTNVFLPLLCAAGHDMSETMKSISPEQDNAITRRMAHVLLGRDHNPALCGTGLRRQGLIQISEDFCLASRGACAECLLPAAIERMELA